MIINHIIYNQKTILSRLELLKLRNWDFRKFLEWWEEHYFKQLKGYPYNDYLKITILPCQNRILKQFFIKQIQRNLCYNRKISFLLQQAGSLNVCAIRAKLFKCNFGKIELVD
ncbi:unnamed protein product [Paramecium octaurelia]|uniref:Uncharacterized protein n=1 Tax=Paramecium octaurelia TaxID=43137 RepID=A0A8S1WH56_PAROT|nr:unnamed protein product [Paramecium octaurelia]